MMAKLEKYGLGLKGLRAACTRTKNCRPYFGGYGVYYDRRKDEVLTTYYRNEDTYRCNKYSDKDIINICYTTEPMTMQRIANAIHSCTELTLTLTQQPRVPDRCSMRGRFSVRYSAKTLNFWLVCTKASNIIRALFTIL